MFRRVRVRWRARVSIDTAEVRAERIAEGLYPHQVEGVAFLLGRRRSILADDMGLGKTRQSVLAMVEAAPAGPYLVVCPASVKHNWAREIGLALGEVPTHVIGAERCPGPDWRGWVIVNYDLLKREIEALKQVPFAGFVFDEAHYLKNHRARRSVLARQLLPDEGRAGDEGGPPTPEEGKEADPTVHVLTGTPLTNRPRDLFPLLQLVRHSLGRSFLAFAKRYCDATRNDYGHWLTAGASNVEELSLQLQGIMLRRRKEEVLDLPPKLRTWIDVEVPDEVRDRLNAVLADFLDDSRRTARGGRAGIAMFAGARRRLAEAKVAQTLDFVRGAVEQGEKVVLFSCFTHATRRFERALGEMAVVVTGEVPTAKRPALIDRFENDDSVRVFIGQIHAAGVGINLTSARVVVFNDLDWVPANHWQAEDRAHRIGQDRTVHVTYMVGAGTLEEFVRSVLEAKSALIDDIVEAGALAEKVGAEAPDDMLAELKRMVGHLGAQAEAAHGLAGEGMETLLRQASREYLERHGTRLGDARRRALKPVSEDAIRALAAVLAGPGREVYTVASSSGGRRYRLEVEGADVVCDCNGFHYRGMCRHARALKEALAGGKDVPEGYERA